MNKSKLKLVILVTIVGIVLITLVVQSINSSKEKFYRLNTECAKQAAVFEKEKNNEGFTEWQIVQTIFNEKYNSCYVEFSLGLNSGIYDISHSKYLIYRYFSENRIYKYWRTDDVTAEKTIAITEEDFFSTKEKIFGNEK